VKYVEGKGVMWKITGARECSRIECFGMNAGERRRRSIRATGHKTSGEFSVILQIVVMVQLTSRRILRD